MGQQVPTTQAACDQTTQDFLLEYWSSKLTANPLVVPGTVSVVVDCNEAEVSGEDWDTVTGSALHLIRPLNPVLADSQQAALL